MIHDASLETSVEVYLDLQEMLALFEIYHLSDISELIELDYISADKEELFEFLEVEFFEVAGAEDSLDLLELHVESLLADEHQLHKAKVSREPDMVERRKELKSNLLNLIKYL